jgi:hypothetical protein
MPNRGKITLHHIKQDFSAPPRKHFARKNPSLFKIINGKIQRRLKQSRGAQMIGCTMTGGICRHIAQNAICRPAVASRTASSISGSVISPVKISAPTTPSVSSRSIPTSRALPCQAWCGLTHLQPATRRTTKINNGHARLQKMIAIIHLFQL